MSEVKRPFEIFRVALPDGEFCRRADVVELEHFDAQRLRADTAEAELKAIKEGMAYRGSLFGQVQAQRDAAAQRIAILSKALTDIRENSEDLGACECAADALKDATLNPKPEAGSHEGGLKFYPPGKCPECDKGKLEAKGYRYECDTCEFNCGEGDHDQ